MLQPHGLQELRDILDRCRSAVSVEDFVAHDIAFHLRIVEAVGNPVLSMLLQVLSTRTQRVRIVRGSRTRDALNSATRTTRRSSAHSRPATRCSSSLRDRSHLRRRAVAGDKLR